MQTLTKEYIQQQDLKTCERLLKEILKDSKLDLPLMNHPELLKDADDVGNTIANLEDRIDYLSKVLALEKANATRWGRVVETPQED